MYNGGNSKVATLASDLEKKYNSEVSSLCKKRKVSEEGMKSVLKECKEILSTHIVSDKDIVDFLSYALCIAYLDGFNNDKSSSGLSGQFGYSKLRDTFDSLLETKNLYSVHEMGLAESNLLSSIRENVSVDNYLSSGVIDEDVVLIERLIQEPEEVDDSEFISIYFEFLKQCKSAFVEERNNFRRSLEAIYRAIFAGGYGIDPFCGLIMPTGRFGSKLHKATKGQYWFIGGDGKAKFNGSFSDDIDPIFNYYRNAMQATFSDERQFNIDAMLSSDRPLLFPFKLMEFAFGKKVTGNIDKYIYNEYSQEEGYNGSYDIYFSKYLSKFVEDFSTKVAFAIYKKLLPIDETTKNGIISAVNNTLQDGTKEDVAFNTYLEKLGDISIDTARTYFHHIKRCCSGIIIVSALETSPDDGISTIDTISVRLVDVSGAIKSSDGVSIFGHKKRQGCLIGDGTLIGTAESFPIYEFRYIADTTAAGAPLFGYKAVEAYAKQNMQLTWDRILLGRALDNTPVFAINQSGENVSFREATTHNVIAGSRSGKGVMTMNILASALAAGKPIFYVDRKPDMASMFYDLAGENMFIVNGGQSSTDDDAYGHWSDADGGAPYSKWWNACKANTPDYVWEIINGQVPDHLQVVGNPANRIPDFVYYRAVLFLMGIVRAIKDSSGEVLSALGGDTGIVIILDEFSNADEALSNFFGLRGSFFGACKENPTIALNSGEDKNSQKAQSDYESKLRQLQIDIDSAKTPAARQKAQEKYDNEVRKHEIDNSVTDADAQSIYAVQVVRKLIEDLRDTENYQTAGFGPTQVSLISKIDIFNIGQRLETVPMKKSMLQFTLDKNDGSYRLNMTNIPRGMGLSYVRGITQLTQTPSNYIMGYNSEHKEYMGADREGSTAQQFLCEREKCFAFVKAATQEDVTTSESTPARAKFFKPYLVLNNNLECPDYSNPDVYVSGTREPKYRYVDQMRSKSFPGAKWDAIRLNHVPDPEVQRTNPRYGTLNEGIGFEGLIKAVVATTGANRDTFSLSDLLSKSGNIANWAAQRLGYPDYKSFLFDFTPYGIGSIEDIKEGILNVGSWQNVEKRLDYYAFKGAMEFVTGEKSTRQQSGVGDGDASYGDTVYDANVSSMNFGESPYDANVSNTGFGSPAAVAEESFEESQDYGYSGTNSAPSDDDFVNDWMPKPRQGGTPTGGTPAPNRASQSDVYNKFCDYINEMRRELPARVIRLLSEFDADTRQRVSVQQLVNSLIWQEKEAFKAKFGINVDDV